MKQIPLTQGMVAIVGDTDYDSLSQFRWYTSKWGNTYYAMRHSRMSESMPEIILMHRIILNAPKGIQIDHINRNGLDNRRANLRFCTRSENAMHQRIHSDNRTGFKGVILLKRTLQKPYIARIWINNKQFHLGCHHTAEAAARAYDLAAVKHYGEFALTNEMLGIL